MELLFMTKILQDVNIGQNLQRLRKAKGFTQNDICAKLAAEGRPMLQSAYAQIERGRRNIFASDLIALKKILQTSYEEIFKDLVPINKYEQNE